MRAELSVRLVEVEEESEVRTNVRKKKSVESGEEVSSKPRKTLVRRIFEGHEEWLGHTPD
jgi:hypothetical protein